MKALVGFILIAVLLVLTACEKNFRVRMISNGNIVSIKDIGQFKKGDTVILVSSDIILRFYPDSAAWEATTQWPLLNKDTVIYKIDYDQQKLFSYYYRLGIIEDIK